MIYANSFTYNSLQVRKANKKDNPYKILELIYNTDAYIYPVLMRGDYKDYTYLLLEQGIYNYKNITLAIVDGEIAGLIISFSKEVISMSHSNQELQNYYKILQESLDNQSEYINNVSVFKNFRDMGIATSLVKFIEKNTRMPKLVLDCLTENRNAIHLYKKLGFTITGTFSAFCLDKTKNLRGVRMEKPIL